MLHMRKMETYGLQEFSVQEGRSYSGELFGCRDLFLRGNRRPSSQNMMNTYELRAILPTAYPGKCNCIAYNYVHFLNYCEDLDPRRRLGSFEDEELETMPQGLAVSADGDTGNESDASMDKNMHTPQGSEGDDDGTDEAFEC
ncbi:hypothetical protein KIN20_037222 [Parelaphostrongylus tenuis]|uniref:Uncharacterized protein n=1 Tax=Parelaphostrongylus tenuis TaxID=148309 RepID=A0AAD5RHM5_PARTN|nr:hypothetical protein KIN20_037222 [Parelaphostrongylus tenuis]